MDLMENGKWKMETGLEASAGGQDMSPAKASTPPGFSLT
jgi:hypothetical protein